MFFGLVLTENDHDAHFFRQSSVAKVVERENLLHTESMGNRVSMFLMVKTHWDPFQVAYDCS